MSRSADNSSRFKRVEANHAVLTMIAEAGAKTGLADHEQRFGVCQDQVDAFRWIVRIDGNIGRASVKHRE